MIITHLKKYEINHYLHKKHYLLCIIINIIKDFSHIITEISDLVINLTSVK